MELRTFLYSQAIMTVAVLLFDVCSFVFYGLALQFPADQFAEVASISALNFVVTVSAAAMGTYVVMQSKRPDARRDFAIEGMRLGIFVALVLLALFAVLSPGLKIFFRFSSVLPFIILGCTAVPVMMINVIQSVLLSQRRFGLLALGLIGYGAGRIPAGYLLFSDGFASTDAPLAILLTSFIGLLIVLIGNGNIVQKRSLVPKLPNREQVTDVLELLWSMFVIGALLKIDILWAKHSLTPVEAGVYGMTSLIGSVLYYVTIGVIRPTTAYITKDNVRSMVILSGGIILGLCALCIGGYFLVGRWIFAMITDHAGDIQSFPLLLLFFGMSGYCLLSFGMQCLGVLHRTVHVKLMTSVVLGDAVLLLLFGHSILRIAAVQMTTLLLGAAAAAYLIFIKKGTA